MAKIHLLPFLWKIINLYKTSLYRIKPKHFDKCGKPQKNTTINMFWEIPTPFSWYEWATTLRRRSRKSVFLWINRMLSQNSVAAPDIVNNNKHNGPWENFVCCPVKLIASLSPLSIIRFHHNFWMAAYSGRLYSFFTEVKLLCTPPPSSIYLSASHVRTLRSAPPSCPKCGFGRAQEIFWRIFWIATLISLWMWWCKNDILKHVVA